MKRWLAFLLAAVIFFAVHEGMHALVATLYDEYEAFHIRPIGLEVQFRTPVAERDGIHWAFLSGVSNLVTVLMGYLLLVIGERFSKASTVTLIIITIGASLLLRGLAQLVWDKRIHSLPAFSGDAPLQFMGATVLPQSLWVLGGAALAVGALSWFFGRTLFGKAMLATSYNPLAASWWASIRARCCS